MNRTKLSTYDPVIGEYKLTPMFSAIRTALMIITLFSVAAVLFVSLSGTDNMALYTGTLCFLAVPVLVYVFGYVSPLKKYRTFVSEMTEEEYISFMKKHAAGKKYITEHPGEKYILTLTDRYMILAQNPVTVIKMSDISWIYQREFKTAAKTYEFIDVHTENKDFYTFTLEDMTEKKAEEIIFFVKKANDNVKTGADAYE